MKEQEWGPVPSKPDQPYADLQGLYVSDMPDGEEHHNWQDGSEYYGEWRDGQPNGRGIFVSQSGQAMHCYSAAAKLLLWLARAIVQHKHLVVNETGLQTARKFVVHVQRSS